MEYRAVNGRLAVRLKLLKLPISDEEAVKILIKKGFEILTVDIISLARDCIGTSTYRRGARPSEAPTFVDCSSFVKYLYGQCGIWLPRRSIQQRDLGMKVETLEEIRKGDVVFVSGYINYFDEDPSDGVGHVGIVSGEGTVIHAADRKSNVVESSLAGFIDERNFRGARRYFPPEGEFMILNTPPEREVEVESDIRWIVLQSLPLKKPKT